MLVGSLPGLVLTGAAMVETMLGERGSGMNVLYPNFFVVRAHAIDTDMETQARVEAARNTFLEEGSTESTLLVG